MAGDDAQDLPDDVRQAVEALRRLVQDHEAIDPADGVEAVRLLVDETEVEASPEALLGLEARGEETESPTA